MIQGNGEKIQIKQVAYDSRKVSQDSIFICIEGFKVDGHQYIDDAVQKGASVLVVQKDLEVLPKGVCVVKVENTRYALAAISSHFYGNPSENLKLIGVTGTNGKTTITYFISTILNYVGEKTGIIGTIENRIGDKVIPTSRTTPESLELQKLLREMKEEDVSHVIMEVSSHSLDLHRVDHCKFLIGIFTNLTLDHLDYHKTMDNYKKAKAKLFSMCRYGIINIDDPYGQYMLDEGSCIGYTYGIDHEADFRAEKIHLDEKGTRFELSHKGESIDIELAIPGKFSVYNSLAAITAAYTLGIPLKEIQEGLRQVSGVRGRFETITAPDGYSVIIDYSHAPDGLLNVLKTIQEFAKGKIITVFGCGGDRDKSKRPVMGEIAGEYSDYCIITSDNPRSEEPAAIIQEIEPGVQRTGCTYTKIIDRRTAIQAALRQAKTQDVILIAGKGHETYQEIGDQILHFDDAEEVKNYFQEAAQ